ncbi:MAG: PIN domain-containing protein, partial [Bacillota bacterium]
MSAKVLVDTNILVYAYDSANPVKQKRALEVLDQLASSHAGALSAQVLAEFVVAVTRKIADPLDFATVRQSVENYLCSWEV